jgi:thiamine-monophosphate kinase
MSDERTEIGSLGEFGLIDHLTRNIEIQNASTILGVGDDAAVIDHFGKQTVITTDLLIEGVHFDLMYTPLKHLGYKSVVVNLSDIYAMNAIPTQIVVGIGFSNRFSVEALDEIYEGVYAACSNYGVDLAYIGLLFLEREKKIFMESPGVQPDLEDESYVIGRLLKPEARKDIVDFLSKADIMPTSMMDISAGLSSEILHICKDGNLGCVLYEEKIPIAEDAKKAAFKFEIDPTACALSGGEDYELLFTIPQSDHDKLVLNENISVIGYMTEPEQGAHIITKGGSKHVITAQGWKQLKK